ncbi:B-4DMT family transporter [Mycobacterium sp. Aquia_216]|uniref:B-4DMT family transporter n=1 Tax=Mycobacterium sp. Aquia_216 TaxID=2991729 RepID=UPI00227BB301|nr:B-4DMT family transporter [Mycobacterium sp. Aquia_216]WAJ47200.1 B-4DMT family transporter [Mycobacterium sp. Aquia_216]
MSNWMVRGLAFAALMVVVRLFQGAIINVWQTQAGLVSVVLLLVFIIAVVVWGLLDGRADAKANADPDRRQDLAMTWLLAGLLAGVLSGAVSWLIALFYKGLYTGGLINEVTTFAAFTALCVFLPGIIGAAVGRWRVDRNPPPDRGAGPDEERADTDVFTAASADDAPTGEVPVQHRGGQAEARTSSVATAERDAPTETIPTVERESPTETIATGSDDAKTEVIRTEGPKHSDPESEWPSSQWGKKD